MALVAKAPTMPPPQPPSVLRRASTSSSVASTSRPIRPPPLPVQKDTSSSAGKVFAKPTKEWTIPDKAKPGRKVSVDEPGNSRQSQNRISQRAHRARKTDYIQTLEDRIKQYEADEIHSNVRLQEVARALKTDNERLKKENEALQASQLDYEAERAAWMLERRALGAALAAAQQGGQGNQAAVVTSAAVTSTKRSSHTVSPPILPLRQQPIKGPLSCPICPDPDPDCPCQQQPATSDSASAPQILPILTPNTRLSPDSSTQLDVLTLAAERVDGTTAADGSCGLCHSREDCLCAIVQPDEGDMFDSPPSKPLIVKASHQASEDCGLCANESFCACKTTSTSFNAASVSPTLATSSRLAAVPLRRAKGPNPPVKRPIWRVTPAADVKEAICSGDPTNCDACRNDSFGQEFCSNLFSRAFEPATFKPCDTCPGDCMSIKSLLNEPSNVAAATRGAIEPATDTMTPDKVWQTLKAHPNSRNANLAMLAEVVAKSTQCLGPRAEVGTRSSASIGSEAVDLGADKRSLRVGTSAVRDALRLLDTDSGDKVDERDVKRRKVEM